jgi:biopolymer transport protein ExbB
MAYSYYKTITVDNTKVSGSTNFSNFPILVKIASDNQLRTTANGGRVTSANGYDIIISSSTDPADKLSFEREKYTATTGEFIAHVKVPTLQASSNTVLYLFYGNSDITTDQQSASGTWDSKYKAVFHMGESSGNISDSTSNNHDYTAGGTGGTYGATGLVNRAINNGGTLYFTNNPGITLSDQDYVTIELIGKVNSFTSNGMAFFNGREGYVFVRFDSSDKLLFYITNGTYYNVTETGYSTDTWYHCFMRFRESDKLYFQVNGTDVNSASNGTGRLKREGTLNSGIFTYQGDQLSNMIIDELRVITTDVGADYGKTSYNSLTSPSTFYTLGSEQEVGGTPAATFIPRVMMF